MIAGGSTSRIDPTCVSESRVRNTNSSRSPSPSTSLENAPSGCRDNATSVHADASPTPAPSRTLRYRANTRSDASSPFESRARSSTGVPFGATVRSTIRLSTAVRAGHAASLHGSSTRFTAIDAYTGSTAANPIASATHATAPDTRSTVGRSFRTLPKSMPFARSSRLRTANAASSFVRDTPVSSKSTAAARCPASSGRCRSIRCAISIGRGLKRSDGMTNLRRSTATRPTITQRKIPRRIDGKRISASTAAVADTDRITSIASAAHAAAIRIMRARTATRSTAFTASLRALETPEVGS